MTTVQVSPEVAGIVDQLRSARRDKFPLRIVGGGTWLDAGRPTSADDRLELGTFSGITSYEPDDLTLTARAGTSLAEIDRATVAHGQWMTLDPFGSSRGTLGATIATGSCGPLASAFGTPRDHVLGCEFVSGAGEVIRAGGRVVKNVAGFDLVRLATGAWGTIGAITEVTVRLRARPEVERTLAVSIGGDQTTITDAWRSLREGDLTLLAAELVSPSLGQELSLGGPSLLVRLGGNRILVDSAATTVASLGECSAAPDEVWRELADAEPKSAIVFRVSTLPSSVDVLWMRASRLAEDAGGYAHASITRGVVRCVLPLIDDHQSFDHLNGELAALAEHFTVVGERLPASLWNVVTRARSTDDLARKVRLAFDPDCVMNRGILGA